MERTTLGATGVGVSQVCLGTWRFGREADGGLEVDRATAHDILDAAWERGIDFIDTANTYGKPGRRSERWIGEWLGDHDRGEVTVATKVGQTIGEGPRGRGLSRKHVRDQVERSLEALDTDYIDLYYVHRWDDDTSVGNVMRTLDDLVRRGTVLHLGISTTAAWRLVRALGESDAAGLERFEVTQPPWDATHQNAARYDELDLEAYLEVCARAGLAVCPYSPLAGGLLTGKYDRETGGPSGSRGDRDPEDFERKYLSERAWAVVDAVRAVGEEVGATPAQVAIRWLIDQPGFSAVVPIVGVRTVDQLAENAGAADVALTADQVSRISAARTGAVGQGST